MSGYTRKEYKAYDGLTLVGDVGGPEGAPTVILLHGGGQTRHSWTETMHRLVDRGYHVINYDARGHGDSEWSEDANYGIETLAKDLRMIRDTVPGPAAFVGASMGGMTSFFAVGSSKPPIADALVLVDIVLRVATSGVEKIRNFMASNAGGFANLEEAADAVVAYNPSRPRPKNPEGLRKNLRLRDDGRLYWHWDPRMMQVKPSSEPPPSRADFLVNVSKGVTIPTLVVRGGRSDVVDDQGIDEMRSLVPQTEVFVVPDAGHMVAGDQNDVFSAGVLEFLDRHFPAH